MERINDSYDANILEDDIGGELWRPIPTFMDFTFPKFRFPSKNILGLTQKATVTGTLDLEEHDSSIAFASVSCTNQN